MTACLASVIQSLGARFVSVTLKSYVKEVTGFNKKIWKICNYHQMVQEMSSFQNNTLYTKTNAENMLTLYGAM